MNTMYLGIGAVVILVILAGVFLMAKRRPTSGDKPAALSNRPKTLAEQQLELEQQRQQAASMPQAIAPAANVPSADDDLAAAQRHLAQHDYTAAANVLKQAIKNHPKRGDLQLQLLNVFAQAKNYDNFNRFYPQVLKLNDAQITQQANNLKSLMDEEQAFSQQTTSINAAAETKDELDFDLGFNEPTPTVTSTVSPVTLSNVSSSIDSDIDFDFDIGAPTSQTVNTNPAIDAIPNLTKEVALPDGGEISFDDFADFDLLSTTPTNQAIVAPTSPTVQNDGLEDFDLSFDDPAVSKAVSIAPMAQTPVAPQVTSESTEDFDFNFDEPAVSEPVSIAPVAQTPAPQATTETVEDFDFNFDEPMLNAATVQQPVTPSISPSVSTKNDDVMFDDFDMDFDSSSAQSTSSAMESATTSSTPLDSQAQPKSANTLADESFDMDFDLDEPKAESPTIQLVSDTVVTTPTPVASQPVQNTDFDDFDLSFDEPASVAEQPQSSPVAPEIITPTNNLSVDDEFSFDDDLTLEVPTDNSVLNVADAPALDTTDLVDQSTQLAEPVTQTPTTEVPLAPVTSTSAPALDDAFDLLKDIDTTQLNIDLAEQYVHLGEYDSAKRLLDEVNVANTPQYQAKVQQLLEKIG